MMLRIVAILLLICTAWGTATAAERAAETFPAQGNARVALVIGNSTYTYANRLKNPKSDASDIAALLRRLQFDVVEGNDLTLEGMVDLIQQFAEKAETAKIALFYYAGHGIQVDGRNYLLAVDTKLERKTLLRYQAIDLDAVTSVMTGDGRTAIVLLDACRDNPLTRSYQAALGASRSVTVRNGLAYPDAKGDGLLIGFATSPGETAEDGSGRNSPYATALLKYLEEPGTQIEQTLKKVARDVVATTKGLQRPWYNSNLNDDFVMNAEAALGAGKLIEKVRQEDATREVRNDAEELDRMVKEEEQRIDWMIGMLLTPNPISENMNGTKELLVVRVDTGGFAAQSDIAGGDSIVSADCDWSLVLARPRDLSICIGDAKAEGRTHMSFHVRKKGDIHGQPPRLVSVRIN